MKTDLIERIKAHDLCAYPEKDDWQDRWCDQADALLREAAAALEAEASEGERRGLERALLICRGRAAIESERATDAQKPNTRSAALWASFKLRCAANDIAALIPEAPVREGWQTIATAPRDGREVLITDGDAVGAGFYDDAPMAYRADAGWFWEDDRANLLTAKNAGATHWMPLPAPPPPKKIGRAEPWGA